MIETTEQLEEPKEPQKGRKTKLQDDGKTLSHLNSTMLRIPNVIYPYMRALRDIWLARYRISQYTNNQAEVEKTLDLAEQLTQSWNWFKNGKA